MLLASFAHALSEIVLSFAPARECLGDMDVALSVAVCFRFSCGGQRVVLRACKVPKSR